MVFNIVIEKILDIKCVLNLQKAMHLRRRGPAQQRPKARQVLLCWPVASLTALPWRFLLRALHWSCVAHKGLCLAEPPSLQGAAAVELSFALQPRPPSPPPPRSACPVELSFALPQRRRLLAPRALLPVVAQPGRCRRAVVVAAVAASAAAASAAALARGARGECAK